MDDHGWYITFLEGDCAARAAKLINLDRLVVSVHPPPILPIGPAVTSDDLPDGFPRPFASPFGDDTATRHIPLSDAHFAYALSQKQRELGSRERGLGYQMVLQIGMKRKGEGSNTSSKSPSVGTRPSSPASSVSSITSSIPLRVTRSIIGKLLFFGMS